MEHQCPFCNCNDVLFENEFALAIFDRFPVSDGHLLIMPKRHVESFFDLTNIEKEQCFDLIDMCRHNSMINDVSISGFNIGINVGKDAGQTIFHCHIHLIPRRHNDVDDPSGGIRHVFPDKGYYTMNSAIMQK